MYLWLHTWRLHWGGLHNPARHPFRLHPGANVLTGACCHAPAPCYLWLLHLTPCKYRYFAKAIWPVPMPATMGKGLFTLAGNTRLMVAALAGAGVGRGIKAAINTVASATHANTTTQTAALGARVIAL